MAVGPLHHGRDAKAMVGRNVSRGSYKSIIHCQHMARIAPGGKGAERLKKSVN
jgi:hypothetical protein